MSWPNSRAIEKLRQAQQAGHPLRLAFFDIDGTWTGNPDDQAALRAALEERHYVISCATNRDLELNLSAAALQKSPPDIASRDEEKRDRAALPGFRGITDLDIVASSLGEEIAPRQIDGSYLLDTDYSQRHAVEKAEWHTYVNDLLEYVSRTSGQRIGTLLPSTHLRVHVTFATLAEKMLFQNTIADLQKKSSIEPKLQKLILHTQLTDESEPYLDSPSFSLFITPATVTKKNAVDHIVATLSDSLQVPRADFEVLISGDGPSDIDMGFYGASGTNATFIIPGGARLNRFIDTNAIEYMDAKFNNIRNHLQKLEGYRVTPEKRIIVIGDEAFPQTTGPLTTLAWLEKNKL